MEPKQSKTPAGDALKAIKLERILEDARFPDSLYRKSDYEVVRAAEKAQNAIDNAQRALREFVYRWRSAAITSFPPPTGIKPNIVISGPRTVNVRTAGGGQAQGGIHAPKPTFPPSATSGKSGKKGGGRK